jgi:hypothetical protein
MKRLGLALLAAAALSGCAAQVDPTATTPTVTVAPPTAEATGRVPDYDPALPVPVEPVEPDYAATMHLMGGVWENLGWDAQGRTCSLSRIYGWPRAARAFGTGVSEGLGGVDLDYEAVADFMQLRCSQMP